MNSILKNFTSKVKENCFKDKALEFLNKVEEPIFIACSGGCDSIFLLMATCAFFPKREKYILHFNHKLRENSDADELLVKKYADTLQIPLITDCRKKHEKAIKEEDLRKLRYRSFLNSIKAKNGRVLLLGHHLNDVAETMFMRLMRGSSIQGLSSPRPVQYFNDGHVRIRPLINLKKDFIKRILNSIEIKWREDESNQDASVGLRNTLRLKIFPMLDKLALPNWQKRTAVTRTLLEEDAESLDYFTSQAFEQIKTNESLNAQKLRNLPFSIFRRILTHWLAQTDLSPLCYKTTEELFEHLQQNKNYKVNIAAGTFLMLTENSIAISQKTTCKHENFCLNMKISKQSTIFLSRGGKIKAKEVLLDNNTKKDIFEKKYDCTNLVLIKNVNISNTLTIRNWNFGDAYQPLGCKGNKKLQDLFTDRKIKACKRKCLPVICSSKGDILWCPGLPPAEKYKICKNTISAIKITYYE